MTATVGDIWRLAYDTGAKAIIMLNEIRLEDVRLWIDQSSVFRGKTNEINIYDVNLYNISTSIRKSPQLHLSTLLPHVYIQRLYS